MKRYFTLVLCTLMCFSVFSLTVSADRTLPLLIDNADILSDTQEDSLGYTLETFSDKLQSEIAVITVYGTDGMGIMEFTDDFYDYNGYGYGENDDGVIMVVDMLNREWWISTHGSCEYILSDNVIYTIENDFLEYLSGGDYYTAFRIFAEKCSEFIEAYYAGYTLETDNANDYIYYEEDIKSSPLDYVIPSLIVGFIISLITVSVMKSGMNTVQKAQNAATYVKNGSLHLTSRSDNYLYSNVVRTRRQTNSSSGGGSISRSSGGTHRSSSGRSHGGRGGRF